MNARVAPEKGENAAGARGQPALAFEKWQGLGNDFVIVEAAPQLDDQLVRRICDRRYGVGADGILIVSGLDGGEPRMIVRNADGSRPEMCGNGIRCVAGMWAHRGGAGSRVVIATDSGPRVCEIERRGDGSFLIGVDMGMGRLGGVLDVTIDGRVHRFERANLGNPHAITFEPYEQAQIDQVGPLVSRAEAGGTNVEFCSGDERRIRVTVWERGVGRTLACGTGACAVALAACATGRARFDQPVEVELPGGVLTVTVEGGSQRVSMRGPAERVFAGEVVIA
jgi:diaminopimelate epimerase